MPRAGQPDIQRGAYASIRVAYWSADANKGKAIEARHLAAVKEQVIRPKRTEALWTEVTVMAGLVHEHIVDYYGCFLVGDQSQGADAGSSDPQSQLMGRFFILMEYASAGDLKKEISRYTDPDGIPEPGARFYLLQIASAIRYMHGKRITHGDLHERNVLLKYRASDDSKDCLVCDFGFSRILDPEDVLSMHAAYDVARVAKLAQVMLSRQLLWSEEAAEVISHSTMLDEPISSIDQLLALPWFRGPAVPPVPRAAVTC